MPQAAFLVGVPLCGGGPFPLGICLFYDQNTNSFFFFKRQNLIFVVGLHENIPQIPEEGVLQI